jgi:UDP-N-acetylglucosamine 1-carboxyvinyltransferase
MPPAFVVEGGHQLSGNVKPAGNKNAALPILAATLLAEAPVVLQNVPRIRDVETMIELLRALNVTLAWRDEHTLDVDSRNARAADLDPDLCSRFRASILLAGPMLARFGRVRLPPPGGDVIGRRRIDTHLLALQRLGADIEVGSTYDFNAKELKGEDIFLDEASVTGTENAIMAAAGARGSTVLRNAASEPHVQDLARFLVGLGAPIEGIGTNTLAIEGGRPLGGGEFTIGPDHVEIGSFIGLAAVTDSALTIEGVRPDDLRSTLMGFAKLGVEPRRDGDRLVVDQGQSRRIASDLGGHVAKLEDAVWPGFPADLMSIALVTASQCDGLVLIHEKLFESRLFFVDKLIMMGARIVLCDPHRAVVAGPSRLRGGTVESPDIRAGMAMLIAALAAEGTSTINNIGQIERGYERIHERLAALGARIERRDG